MGTKSDPNFRIYRSAYLRSEHLHETSVLYRRWNYNHDGDDDDAAEDDDDDDDDDEDGGDDQNSSMMVTIYQIRKKRQDDLPSDK